jgi:hypothetical protein
MFVPCVVASHINWRWLRFLRDFSNYSQHKIPQHTFNLHFHNTLAQYDCTLLGEWWDWVHLARRPLTGLFYQPRMIDDESGAVGGMRIGRGNRSTRRKSASVPLYPPQIPHDLIWARTVAAAVGSRRLTTWATAWHYDSKFLHFQIDLCPQLFHC